MNDSIGIYHRIENLKTAMEGLEGWPDIEVTFSHETAFEVTAHVRAIDETGMRKVAQTHECLTNHGFEEVDTADFGTDEWAYEWHHSNY